MLYSFVVHHIGNLMTYLPTIYVYNVHQYFGIIWQCYVYDLSPWLIHTISVTEHIILLYKIKTV